jgi:hypothetical protein
MTGHPTIPDVTDKDIAWIADTVGLMCRLAQVAV